MPKKKSSIKIHQIDTWNARFTSGVSSYVLHLKKSAQRAGSSLSTVEQDQFKNVSLNLNTKISQKRPWNFSWKIPHWRKPRWEFVSLSTLTLSLVIAFILIAPLHAFSFFEETKKDELERIALFRQYAFDIKEGFPRQKEMAELYRTSSEEALKWLPLLQRIPWIGNNARIFFENLEKNFPHISLIGDFFLRVFTNPEEQRYLIFFQNNQEIRPTGGFLGSFLFLGLKNGKIERFELPSGGTYDLNGQLKNITLSPEPLHIVNERWECQDMNWFFDFPASAKKMKECYEKSRGETIDGIATINASLLPSLFSLLGSIEDPSSGKVLTSENILSFLTYRVEVESYSRGEEPKQILKDIFPRIRERVNTFSFTEYQNLFKLFFDGLARREIQLYAEDASLQKLITLLGWSGDMLKTDGDYLAVVHTNIGGEKTDAVMSEDIVETTSIEEDGTLINEVKITRSHHGKTDDLFTGVKSQDYVRVYVPFGSIFLSGIGFDHQPLLKETSDAYLYSRDEDVSRIESSLWIDTKSETKIYDEFGKTVFANWILLEPGETKTVTLRYRLPYKLPFVSVKKDFFSKIFHPEKDDLFPYHFYMQRQSGVANQTFQKIIEYPDKKFFLNTVSPEMSAIVSFGKVAFSAVPVIKDLSFFIMLTSSYERSQ